MQNESVTYDYLFVGTHGHVMALDKRDGTTVWDTSLPKTGFQVAALLVEDDMLLCGSGGRVFALDPLDGRILWENGLPGRGSGVVALATMRQSPDGTPGAAAQQAASQAASTNTAAT